MTGIERFSWKSGGHDDALKPLTTDRFLGGSQKGAPDALTRGIRMDKKGPNSCRIGGGVESSLVSLATLISTEDGSPSAPTPAPDDLPGDLG